LFYFHTSIWSILTIFSLLYPTIHLSPHSYTSPIRNCFSILSFIFMYISIAQRVSPGISPVNILYFN
jgi:hypothetical protein